MCLDSPGCDSLGSWPFSYKDTYNSKVEVSEVSEVSSLQNLQDESVVTVRAGSTCSISQTTPATSTCLTKRQDRADCEGKVTVGRRATVHSGNIDYFFRYRTFDNTVRCCK